VKDAIASAALCWRCIATKAELTARALDDVLIVARAERSVALQLGPCGRCGADTLLYRLVAA
jgi:hypothetical protein